MPRGRVSALGREKGGDVGAQGFLCGAWALPFSRAAFLPWTRYFWGAEPGRGHLTLLAFVELSSARVDYSKTIFGNAVDRVVEIQQQSPARYHSTG